MRPAAPCRPTRNYQIRRCPTRRRVRAEGGDSTSGHGRPDPARVKPAGSAALRGRGATGGARWPGSRCLSRRRQPLGPVVRALRPTLLRTGPVPSDRYPGTGAPSPRGPARGGPPWSESSAWPSSRRAATSDSSRVSVWPMLRAGSDRRAAEGTAEGGEGLVEYVGQLGGVVILGPDPPAVAAADRQAATTWSARSSSGRPADSTDTRCCCVIFWFSQSRARSAGVSRISR